MNPNEQALSVTQVNRYVKMLMEGDSFLSAVTVSGEISNLKYHTSGHLYFTLKDEESELAAVMFRGAVQSMNFTARNGMRVTVYGRISVYEKSGRYQLYASAMVDDGIGRLYAEYEKLKKRLEAEGLFDSSRKRPLPKFPRCIGVITSPTGAAVRDMIQVTGRRYPAAKILLFPSLVQGSEAPASLCRALAYLNADSACDVIIIGRGGGSIEDLWAFNDEALVRAVAMSHIPVISAVGHETDFTLCDFAADCRAPTPTAAAELAVPDRDELLVRLDDAAEKLDLRMTQLLKNRELLLAERFRRLDHLSPVARLREMQGQLENKQLRLASALKSRMNIARAALSAGAGRLNALSPLAVLERGYSVVEREDGTPLSSVRQMQKGDRVHLLLADGRADAELLAVKRSRNNRKNEDEVTII